MYLKTKFKRYFKCVQLIFLDTGIAGIVLPLRAEWLEVVPFPFILSFGIEKENTKTCSDIWREPILLWVVLIVLEEVELKGSANISH